MKKSIARKLAIQVSSAFAAAFMLLVVGAFILIKRGVKLEVDHYAKALVGIYGDLAIYDSNNMERPVDLSFSDRLSYFGEYLCTWYRVDYFFAYTPDIENGTITYLSFTIDKDKFGDKPEMNLAGTTLNHTLTENELRAWNDSTYYAVEKYGLFGRNEDVMMRISDNYGNKVMVGAAVSIDELRSEMMNGFLIVVVLMFILIALLAFHLHLFIRRMVTEPAKRISQNMSEYISEGKRSSIKLEADGNDEFSMIAGAFNHMTEEIDNYIEDINLMGREREHQLAEVDIASEIQKGILSSGSASLSHCGIRAVMKPAKYIGGDLYDYLELDDTHTLAVIADVSGKGISSAILMAVALTLIRQFAKLGHSPAGILKNVNATFSEENPKMMFITAFVCIYNSESGILTYANAGHNPPYLISDSPRILSGSEGTPLGLFSGEEYSDVEIRMEEGDSVFLYTDGVNEAVNESGEFYGTERLERILEEAAKKAEKHIVEDVETSVREFAGNAEQNDDITMLNLFVRNKPVIELGYDISEFAVIRECIFASPLPRPLLMDLCVAAEECFVNICSYAFDGPAPEGEKILFYFEYSNNVVMRFSDGGRRFDPRCGLPNKDEYDIDTAVGGLGRLIAFTVADSVEYEYTDGRNILTITKSIN